MADVKAVTRIEAILNGEDITPVTREEAILSGADVEPLSREEYFVQKRLGEGGGGGGLDYVIPEQTLQVYTEFTGNIIHDVDVSGLENGDKVAARVVLPDMQPALYYGTYTTEGGENIAIPNADGDGGEINVGKMGDQWILVYLVSGNPSTLSSLTITVIKDF